MTPKEFLARFKAYNDKLYSLIGRVRKIPNYSKSSDCTSFISRANGALTVNRREYQRLAYYPENLKGVNMEYYISELEEEFRIFEIKCTTLERRPPIYVPYDPNKKRF